MAKRKVREYNRTFTPPRGKGKAYTIANIPAALWAKVQVRARREGVSIRAELLRYLTAFAEGARVPVIAREDVDAARGDASREQVATPATGAAIAEWSATHPLSKKGQVVYVTVPDDGVTQ